MGNPTLGNKHAALQKYCIRVIMEGLSFLKHRPQQFTYSAISV